MYEPTLTQPSAPGTPPSSPRNGRQAVRSLFWPGFAGAFLLLSLFSCGGLAMTFGLNKINLSELKSSGPVWTPPAITPEPPVAPASGSTGNTTTSPGLGAFQVGDVVRNITNSRVNMRATPGYQSKGNGDILAQLAPNDTMKIIGDRTVADNLTWWQVDYKGVQGWVAEATASGVQILAK